VLKGFIVGLALTIIIGQVPKLLGVEKTPGNFFDQAWGVIKHLPDTHWLSLVVGLSSLILVLALKRSLPLVPGSLVVVILSILVVWLFGLDDRGVKIVATSTLAFRRWVCRTASGGGTICRCSAQPLECS
jgi:SulP family sulfate permease